MITGIDEKEACAKHSCEKRKGWRGTWLDMIIAVPARAPWKETSETIDGSSFLDSLDRYVLDAGLTTAQELCTVRGLRC